MNNIGIIIQCRDYATRYSEKSVRPFHRGKSILEILIDRFKHFPYKTVVATEPKSLKTIEICHKTKTPYYLGSEENVLKRIYETACVFKFDGIFRVCADSPFIQLGLIYPIIKWSETGHYGYISFERSMRRHEGFYIEYVSMWALGNAYILTDICEHVTPYIIEHSEIYRQKILPIPWELDKWHLRLTVDTESDFVIARKVYKYVGEKHWFAILDWVLQHPEVYKAMQKNIRRNPK